MMETAPTGSAGSDPKPAIALATGLLGMIGAPAALFALGGEESDPAAGLVAVVIGLGLVFSVAAIVIGALARPSPSGSKPGLAIAGIVMGILGVLFVGFLGVVVASGQKLY